MYISEVSGHHQATLAIEKSLKFQYPSVDILNINGFSYTYPIIEKIVNKAYMGVIKSTPNIWNYLYDNPKVAKRIQKIKNMIHKANHQKLEKLFKEFEPDCVVCTQAFPCGMVADYKVTQKKGFKIIGVLTDYAPHSYWIHEGVDYYIVPCEETGDLLIQKGARRNQVRPYGIPVDPKFTSPLNKNYIFRKLRLDSQIPVVLIMGGGQGLGPIKEVIKSLLKAETELQMIVVSGTNKKLWRWIKKAQKKAPKKMIAYEFANNIEELMAISVLTVTKPGGMTTAEALVKGLPMVIIKPIPGQEMHNTEYLLKKGLAIRINKNKNIGRDMEELLNSQERLCEMRAKAIDCGKPNSAGDIADLIMSSHG